MATLKSSLILTLTDRVTGASKGVMGSMRRLRMAGERLEASNKRMMAPVLGGVGRLAALAGAYIGVSSAISGTVGAAISFQDAMSDVKKVINFDTPEQFTKMRQDIIDLSKEIPRTAEGFAQMYAAAGQSGIAQQDLKAFAKMAAQVGVAWDVSDEKAGQALAEMKTALGRDIAGIGRLADAINYLGNNSAASSPRILDFEQTVAAFAETAGFTAEQAAAFGAAMIGSGFQADVASTSFRNMARALTSGEAATKSQETAFKQLGLSAVGVAKRMQKDATGTTLDVIERISKLPKYRQGAISNLLFGSEARALPAITRNTKELRRTLGLVNDEATYAGSAEKEFESVADRTSNRISLMWNNIRAWAIGVGETWLPMVSSAADKISDTFKTLSERVTVFDEMNQRIKGFLRGLGFEDGTDIVSAFNQVWDQLFGRVDDGIKDSDRLAAAFEKWRQAGQSVRAFGQTIRDNIESFEKFFGLKPGAIGRFFGDLGGWVLPLVAASAGIAMFAGTVSTLTNALLVLSGVKLAWGVLRWASKLAGLAGSAATGANAVATTASEAAGGTAAAGLGLKGWAKALGITGALATVMQGIESLGDTPGDTFEDQVANQKKYREGLQRIFGLGDETGEAVKDNTRQNTDNLQKTNATLTSIDGTLKLQAGYLAGILGNGQISNMLGGGGFSSSPAYGAAGARSMDAPGRPSPSSPAGGARAAAGDPGTGASGRRTGGTRSWRNNNPGNIEYRPWTKNYGATGSDGRFAIFSSYAGGRAAQRHLLFNSALYRNKTLQNAIKTWAPASENNVPAYRRAMGGDPSMRMREFSPSQQEKLLDAMQRHEGWRAGTVTPERDASVAPKPRPRPSAGAAGNPSGRGGRVTQVNNSPQIHVHAAPGMDEKKLADMVQRRISDSYRTTAQGAYSDGVD